MLRSHLALDQLGQVTLFVGANNSGKTSLREAIHLFTSREDPESVYSSMIRRGEARRRVVTPPVKADAHGDRQDRERRAREPSDTRPSP